MEKIHIFLKSEFERLGLTAAQAARDANEPDSQGLRDVLAGRKRLSADLLSALTINTEIDALYILTGLRTPQTQTPLSPDEQLLLEGYRAMDAAAKKGMLAEALGVPKTSPHGIKQRNKGGVSFGVVNGNVNQGDQTNHIQGGMNFGGNARPGSKPK